jgi:hypothetical protein
MTRLRILLATLTVVPALVATVPAVAQPGGNPIPGNGGVFELAWTGDISPPVGEPRGDDYGTSELALAGQPDAVALPGDLVYECGSPAAFTSPVGYHGSWGRLRGISYFPALGNHDVCEPGPGAPLLEEVNRHLPPPQGLVGGDRARCRGGVARHEQRSPHNNLGE